jgi:hypothetical protein
MFFLFTWLLSWLCNDIPMHNALRHLFTHKNPDVEAAKFTQRVRLMATGIDETPDFNALTKPLARVSRELCFEAWS